MLKNNQSKPLAAIIIGDLHAYPDLEKNLFDHLQKYHPPTLILNGDCCGDPDLDQARLAYKIYYRQKNNRPAIYPELKQCLALLGFKTPVFPSQLPKYFTDYLQFLLAYNPQVSITSLQERSRQNLRDLFTKIRKISPQAKVVYNTGNWETNNYLYLDPPAFLNYLCQLAEEFDIIVNHDFYPIGKTIIIGQNALDNPATHSKITSLKSHHYRQIIAHYSLSFPSKIPMTKTDKKALRQLNPLIFQLQKTQPIKYYLHNHLHEDLTSYKDYPRLDQHDPNNYNRFYKRPTNTIPYLQATSLPPGYCYLTKYL